MPLPTPPILRPHLTLLNLSLSLSALTASMSTTPAPSSSSPSSSNHPPTLPTTFPTTPYHPRHATWPYTPADFTRADPTPDPTFYSAPRYVTHIDDHAIRLLQTYYAQTLPQPGRILDLCSSWISHFPPALEAAATTTTRTDNNNSTKDPTQAPDLEVTGLGLSFPELAANRILTHRITHDLNADPFLPATVPGELDAATCVVSVDYLASPREVLGSLRGRMKRGGVVHLVVSNRCFPSKVVGRWLRVDEEERLRMVGDYLWFSGWRGVEVVVLSDGRVQGEGGWFGFGGGRVDPLWVVRGVNVGEAEDALAQGGDGEARDER